MSDTTTEQVTSIDTEELGEDDVIINFASNEYKLFDENDYVLIATDYKKEECGPSSKNPGAPMYKFNYIIAEGEFKGEKIPPDNFVIIPSCMPMLTSFMIAVGLYTKEEAQSLIDSGQKVPFRPKECLNRPFIGHLKKTTYNRDGESIPKNEVSYYKPLD